MRICQKEASGTERARESYLKFSTCIFTDNPSVPLNMQSTIRNCLSTSVVEHLSAGDNSILKLICICTSSTEAVYQSLLDAWIAESVIWFLFFFNY